MSKQNNLVPAAIAFFAVGAFLLVLNFAIPAREPANVNSQSINVSTTQLDPGIDTSAWQTYTDASNDFSVQYPNDWFAKNCGDAMLMYFAPNEFECGAGLDAIGIQRTLTEETISAAVMTRQAQLRQVTVLDLTVDGQPATRIIGMESETAVGEVSSRQNDDIYFRQGSYLWNMTSTLQDDGRVFLAMAESFKRESE